MKPFFICVSCAARENLFALQTLMCERAGERSTKKDAFEHDWTFVSRGVLARDSTTVAIRNGVLFSRMKCFAGWDANNDEEEFVVVGREMRNRINNIMNWFCCEKCFGFVRFSAEIACGSDGKIFDKRCFKLIIWYSWFLKQWGICLASNLFLIFKKHFSLMFIVYAFVPILKLINSCLIFKSKNFWVGAFTRT